jgi:hypothetical protein
VTARTLYAEALEAGLVAGHHESDLYLTNTGEARALVAKHGRIAYGFRDAVTGKPSLDVPFAFQPFWDRVAERSK